MNDRMPARPYTKTWLKALKRAVEHPTFKVTKQPLDFTRPNEITDDEWSNLQEARLLILRTFEKQGQCRKVA